MSTKKLIASLLMILSIIYLLIWYGNMNMQDNLLLALPSVALLIAGIIVMPNQAEENLLLDEKAIKLYRQMVRKSLITPAEYEIMRARITGVYNDAEEEKEEIEE